MKKRMYGVYRMASRRRKPRLRALRAAVSHPGGMPRSVTAAPLRGEGEGVRLPVSKSQAARYLVASYFAGTLGYVRGLDACDDIKVLHEALLKLEFNTEWLGKGEPPLDLHASGTALRFITAVTASTPGADFLVTGVPRLMERPMAPLLEALKEAGASIEPRGEDGDGPYRIIGRRLKGGDLSIRGDVSSQFISAMMLCAPKWERGMRLRFTTPVVSWPYIEMTAAVMRDFGLCIRLSREMVEIPPCDWLAPLDYKLEADWSAAAFFYQYAAGKRGRELLLRDLPSPATSLQGDSSASSIFLLLGVKSEFLPEGARIKGEGEMPERVEVDMSGCSDMVPAFLLACLASGVRCRIKGVGHLRHKESDRVDVLRREVRKIGYILNAEEDAIGWEGERCLPEEGERCLPEDAEIDPHDDHRIAMAFGIYGAVKGGVKVSDPECVGKSFPGFWEELKRLGE